MALQTMAPQSDWGWIKNIYMKIKRRAPIVRQKRHRIQSSKLLCQLGVDLMIESEQRDGLSPLEQAQQYRDGLIIALLAIRPLRTKTLWHSLWGKHWSNARGDSGSHSAQRRRNRERRSSIPFQNLCCPNLDHYIDYVRPYLMLRHRSSARRAGLQLPGNFLWISSNGGPLSKNAFFDLVSKRTAERFGTAINPHLFRDCLATTVATETPDAVSSTSQLLGHASLLTSERHYNHADGLKASRLLQTHVLASSALADGTPDKKPIPHGLTEECPVRRSEEQLWAVLRLLRSAPPLTAVQHRWCWTTIFTRWDDGPPYIWLRLCNF